MDKPRAAPSKANGSLMHRVLIGVANSSLRDLLFAILMADGHEVVGMASGPDLLDTLAVSLQPECGSGKFDLVIAETRMLDKGEAMVFSELGRRAKAPPFIFIVTYGDKKLQVKAKQFGALAMVDTPLDLDNLRQIVNSSLDRLAEERDSTPRMLQPEMEQMPQSVA
jgi:DNA-binding NtrC family response regulator